ncbi:MAG: hypothetical protein KBD16_00845 [Candidatus Pacebacteria bacterium]|nr:hypothetical protein [Candidatus Paceibacterota bacterium]
MDPTLKDKITDKLRAFLNREPTESEVINGQTDSNLMGWIVKEDIEAQKVENKKLKADIVKLNNKV